MTMMMMMPQAAKERFILAFFSVEYLDFKEDATTFQTTFYRFP
jgi:hypothetical protein